MVHVDDLLFTGNGDHDKLGKKLAEHVKVQDLGECKLYLGIAIHRDLQLRSIALSQRAYISSIISQYGFADVKPLSVPIDPHQVFAKDQCPQSPEEFAIMRDKPFREALGALMYVAVATRPDIMFAVCQLARYSQNPGIEHWHTLKCVFQYLKGTLDWRLTYCT